VKVPRESSRARKEKLDVPPVAPSLRAEPQQEEAGKLLQEPTNVKPLKGGFEKGAFLVRSFHSLLLCILEKFHFIQKI
jgi:hypothetical protein